MRTTHNLTPEQKENLFSTHKDLIYMTHSFGGYMLRRQIKTLYHLLSGKDFMDIEFDISELILTGFLLQKSINKDTRTQMLYLSKFPKSKFMDVDRSGDVPAINWTNNKIMEQIFKIDYVIEKVIPDMNRKDFQIDTDNIMAYLQYNGSNLFLSNNQVDMVTFYYYVWNALVDKEHSLTDDFTMDVEIAKYDMKCFEANQLKKGELPPLCQAKIRRDTEMGSYNSDIEKSKYFYSLKNFASHGFYIESIQYNYISICYFDSMNNIQTKKLYQQLCYILLMFQRYLNSYDVMLHCTVFTWVQEKADQLHNEENKRAFDFYRQEWVEENKKHKTFKDIGLLPQYWDYITVDYVSEELFSKYNVHL